MQSASSQSLEERASSSQGNSQWVLIFDTISKRSEMITTNGRVNDPSVAKGICPKAGDCSCKQLPMPDCIPDGWLHGARSECGVLSMAREDWCGFICSSLTASASDNCKGISWPWLRRLSHPSWDLVYLVWVARLAV